MEYKVAIIEDDPDTYAKEEEYFHRFSSMGGDSFVTVHFNNAEAFLINYKPEYDLVFMDIVLPHTNGMDAAAWLRKLDPAVTLVFVTNMAQFAVRGYEVDAFDFLVKPVTYEHFELKLRRILLHLSSISDKQIIISDRSNIYRIRISQLRYVEVHGHDLTYHTTEGNISAYGNLKKAEQELDPQRFARCNSCYLVHLKYVEAVHGNSIIVAKEELQMSRPKKKSFIEALNNYIGGNL